MGFGQARVCFVSCGECASMCFIQIVMGPPGSGKTTYCDGAQQILTQLGRFFLTHQAINFLTCMYQKCCCRQPWSCQRQSTISICNWHPHTGEPQRCDGRTQTWPQWRWNTCAISLIFMIFFSLQTYPSDGLLYGILRDKHKLAERRVTQAWPWWNSLLLNTHSLWRQIPEAYFIFDCPGQVELYTHHHSVRNICTAMDKWGLRVGINFPSFIRSSLSCSWPRCISLTLTIARISQSSFPPFLCAYRAWCFLRCLTSMFCRRWICLNHSASLVCFTLNPFDISSFKTFSIDFGLDCFAEPRELSYLLEAISESTTGTKRFKKVYTTFWNFVHSFDVLSAQCCNCGNGWGHGFSVISHSGHFCKFCAHPDCPQAHYWL